MSENKNDQSSNENSIPVNPELAQPPVQSQQPVAVKPVPMQNQAVNSAVQGQAAPQQPVQPVHMNAGQPPIPPASGGINGEPPKSKIPKWLIILIASILGISVIGGIAASIIWGQPDGKSVELNVIDTGFVETGVFYLGGAEKYSDKQIKDNLSFKPDADFAVSRDREGLVEVKILNHRNIGYKGIFKTSQKENAREITFVVNGPPLTMSIENYDTLGEQETLILSFSEQIDIDSLMENLKITPEVEFYMDYNLNMLYITPNYRWTEERYQIDVSADYVSAIGKQFAINQVAQFKTVGYEDTTPTVISRTAMSSVTSTERNLKLHFGVNEDAPKDIKMTLELYKFDNLDTFKESSAGVLEQNNGEGLKDLELLSTTDKVIDEESVVAELDHTGAGGYIIVAKYHDPKLLVDKEYRYTYLVSPLSVYMQASKDETIVWLNDTVLGGPAANYTITMEELESQIDPKYATNAYGEAVGEEEDKELFVVTGTTDADGLLVLPHKNERAVDSPNFSITDAEGKLVYYDRAGLSFREPQQNLYYSYLYLDRSIYRPNDTINFWGFARPYKGNTKEMPKEVIVSFDPGGLDIEQKVQISESGVYHGTIELEGIKSSQYSVSARFDFEPDENQKTEEGEESKGTSVRLNGDYISVKEFEKPKFKIEVEADKSFYGPKDDVVATITASFYDGTPLPNYPIELSYYDNSKHDWVAKGTVETDAEGKLEFKFPAMVGGDRSIYSATNTNSYRAKIANDGENTSTVGSYSYATTDTITESKVEEQADGKNLQMTIKAYEFDVNSAKFKKYIEEKEDTYYWYYGESKEFLEAAKGAPKDIDMQLSMDWYYRDMKKNRYRNYQSREGQSYETYANSYSTARTTVSTPNIAVVKTWETHKKNIAVSTENGVAVIKDLIYLPEGRTINFEDYLYFQTRYTFKDFKEQTVVNNAYYYGKRGEFDYNYENEEAEIVKGFSFGVKNIETGENLTPTTAYYRDIYMNIGDKASFDLLYDSETVPDKGKIMYSIIRGGTYENHIVDATTFDITYKEEYSKGGRMIAAYFDGKETYFVKQLSLYANDDNFKIEIDVKADKESYKPGDKVKLNIKSTDYLGKGVAGNLCISVVDESVFAVSEQYVNVLGTLYADEYSLNNYAYQYFTTLRDGAANTDYWAPGKEAASASSFYDSYRSNFRDTAVFIPTTTDSSGNGTAEFVLPDNNTSWRITAVEVGHDLKAGNAKTNIISTLPYFTQPVITSKYIDGDDITMIVQGHGIALDKNSNIDYEVTIVGDETDITLKAAGVAYEPKEFNFGKLPMGKYKVIAKSQFSGYSDTVELPLSVIKSNLELVVHKELDLTKPIDIEAVRFPVTITIYDKTDDPFYKSISSILGHYCMATNQRMSRVVAKREISKHIGDDFELPSYLQREDLTVAEMQNFDGGVGEYLGGISHPHLTAYMALVAPEEFNQVSMATYFRNTIERPLGKKPSDDEIEEILGEEDALVGNDIRTKPITYTERAISFLGLAALGKVEKSEILVELKNTDYKIPQRAYLIAALAYLGDATTATKMYNDELHKHVEKTTDSAKHKVWEERAAGIWIAASKLNEADADSLSLYFGNYSWRYRTLYECMTYITNYTREVKQSSFTYKVNGVEETVQFGKERGRNAKTLVLSKSDLRSLEFIKVDPTIQATAYYIGEPAEMGTEQSENFTISKNIKPIKDDTYRVEVTVTFKESAPRGIYDISDWVPSNTRLYETNTSYAGRYMYIRNEGQKIYTSFYRHYDDEKTISFSYDIRQTYNSEAVLDTAYIVHGESGENAHTDKSMFTPSTSSKREVISANKK